MCEFTRKIWNRTKEFLGFSKTLSMYTSRNNAYIAYSKKDALSLYCEGFGFSRDTAENYSFYSGSLFIGSLDYVTMKEEITLDEPYDNGEGKVTKTAQEWIDEFGRCCLYVE
ncbi:MAG: hypothetical protein KAS04_04105 [Candidatus Aenigmarchaeota archaeon]|nr:hypothetical protein [Candidatus Aenigmarchaeota archaeon]